MLLLPYGLVGGFSDASSQNLFRYLREKRAGKMTSDQAPYVSIDDFRIEGIYVYGFVKARNASENRMAYVDPNKVVSPKAHWTLIKVLRNGEIHGKGDGDASLAIGHWDDWNGEGPYPVFATRWNGVSGEKTGVGNPQSRGLPTWFIIPAWMNKAILDSDLIPDGEKPLVAALLG